MLQYYMHIPHPEDLPDEVWAGKYEILKHIRERESKESNKQK
jgi:hypothetical protein